jgi:hypothetical protein
MVTGPSGSPADPRRGVYLSEKKAWHEFVVKQRPHTPPVREWDMQDKHDYPLEGKTLKLLLEACRDVIEPKFKQVNKAALDSQKKHGDTVKLAAALGTLAVVLAIVQLARIVPTDIHIPAMIPGFFSSPQSMSGEIWLVLFEAGSAAVALVAIVTGVWAGRQEHWLAERHQAERLRALKFDLLLDPNVWKDEHHRNHRLSQLHEEVAIILSIRPWRIHEIITGEIPLPRLPHQPANDVRDEDRELLAYFAAKRLRYQLSYFDSRIQRYRRSERLWKSIPPLLFFFSVGAALIHFALDLVTQILEYFHLIDAEKSHFQQPELSLSVILLLLAAVLPVIGTGIRTYRMANEFGRNIIRFEANRATLEAILEEAIAQPSRASLFADLARAQQLLALEHREWLRLMYEAEWFA